MKKNMKKKGFTLIELIVVIAILGILAAILVPRFGGFQEKARKTQALVDAKQIATALDSYYAENDKWPDTAAESQKVLDMAFGTTAEATAHGAWTATQEPHALANGGFEWTTAGGYKAGRTATGKVEYK